MNIVRYLIGEGVDTEISDDDGWTLLHLAARGGHTELLKNLLKNRDHIDRKVCQ